MNTLKPARTREECINWLTLEEVEKEVFAAFVGAQSHTRHWDFANDAAEQGPESVLEPGTVVAASDGQLWWSRSQFLEYMAVGIVWRLEALAKRKGVDLFDFDVSNFLNSPVFREKGFAAPYFASLGGEVHTVSEVDIDAMPEAQRKAFKAAMKACKPVTLPKGVLGGK